MLQRAAVKVAVEDAVFNTDKAIARKTGPRLREVPNPHGRPPRPAAARPERPEAGADWLASAAALPHLDIRYDARDGALWQFMNPRRRPSFTPELLRDMSALLDLVGRAAAAGAEPAVRYLILASRMPGIFNLGGDLPLFMQLIRTQDRAALARYAHACIDVQYRRAVNLDLPVHTICLVQGDALGGGFEAALAHDVIIAERSAKFGLPEILFNLFPGMGAYSFLSRRLDPARAERMILSGRIYAADELHDMGLVEAVAEDGRGEQAVADYIARDERTRAARQAVRGLSRMVDPVTREELIRITDLWVDTALALEPRDLRRMEHLALAQDRRWAKIAASAAAPAAVAAE